MAELKTIEIICIPCHKCEVIREKIEIILRCIESAQGIRTHCELISYPGRKEAMKALIRSGYAINQIPIVLINGEVAFTGSRITEQRIRLILEGIMKY